MKVMLVNHPDEIVEVCESCNNNQLEVFFLANWQESNPIIPVMLSCSECGTTRNDTLHLILVEDHN